MRRKAISVLLSLLMMAGLIVPVTFALAEGWGEVLPPIEESSDSAADDAANNSTASEAIAKENAPSDEQANKIPATPTDMVEADFDAAEAYAYITSLDDALAEEYFNGLSQAQQAALIEYAQAKALENYQPPKTVVFTEAGPFLGAVDVSPRLRFKSAPMPYGAPAPGAAPAVDNPGVVTSASIVPDGDGYKLRMEAYVTGATTTTTVTQTTPVDIVLVLDQSGSMAYDFDGDSTSTITERRQYAMKQAVNGFIDAVAAEYDAATSDHRMAIVTYGNSASNLQGWTFVDTSGASTLKNKINDLPDSPSGSTRTDYGMSNAVNLMGSGYSYNGSNTMRQKVVIMFTDGVPTSNREFQTSVANSALGYSQTLKNNGVSVYAIGIFNGADVNQLHGDKYERMWPARDVPCNGSVGSYWGTASVISFFGDVQSYDVPAGNRFLNYLSSNFANVTDIGLKDYHGAISQSGWEITANATRTTTGYYLTAASAGDLDNIFTTISEQIQSGGASVSLNSETIVAAQPSEYFILPDGITASDITVKTADCNSFNGDTPNWTNEHTVSLTPTINGNSVTVSGFDFSANWVGKDTVTGVAHSGKKLIIEIPIQPDPDFLGGNDVPAASGSITAGGVTIEDFETENMVTDVPLVSVTATGNADKNVYLLGGLTNAQLAQGIVVTAGEVDLDLDPDATNFGLEDWQNEYVDISVVYEDENGATITSFANLTEDQNYTVTVTITQKTGTANPQSDDASCNVKVFKPEVRFSDSAVYYGANMPTDFAQNTGTPVWKNGDTVAGADIIGTEPTVDFAYDVGGVTTVNTKADIGVDVTAKIGTTDITQYAQFSHIDCEDVTDDLPEGKEFILHVKTCTLTITKQGGNGTEPYVFTIKKDGNAYTQATVMGGSSVIVYELPVGTYTIEEDAALAWRYSAQVSGNATLDGTNPQGTITCTNTLQNNKWLSAFAAVVSNVFSAGNN